MKTNMGIKRDEPYHIKDVKTAEEMFTWRKQKNKTDVEGYNEKDTCQLGWENTDVLYSFLGIYAIGVYAYNNGKRCFNVTDYLIKEGRKNIYNDKFLRSIQNSAEYNTKDLNNDIKPFLERYSKIGNVYPIWPGGNTAKGNATIGCFDIPELYFARNYEWFKALLRIYKGNIFFAGYIDKGKPKLKKYSNLKSFLKTVDTPKKYGEFINSINDTIDYRTAKIAEELIMRQELMIREKLNAEE